MKALFLAAIFLFSLPQAFASDKHVNISLKGTKFIYPLPVGWCDITQTESGINALSYLQAVNNQADVGINVRLILKPCKRISSAYPWAYVALSELDKFSGSSQYVFNQTMKRFLNTGFPDEVLDSLSKSVSDNSKEMFDVEIKSDSSAVNNSVILKSDDNSLSFYAEQTSKVGGEILHEFTLTSLTTVKGKSVNTYYFNDVTESYYNTNNVKLLIENAKNIAELNRRSDK